MRAQQLRTVAPADRAPLRLVELPPPEPADDELRLRISACAVCRTDLQIAEGDLVARRLPIVLGHQAVGIVEAIGPAVTGWRLGERAGAFWLASTDGSCRWCRRGDENLCPAARFTGWDRDGGFAESMTITAGYAVRLPEGVADLDAAPLLCGGVIGYRALRRSGIEPGGRLGLYGFGASATLAIQVARYWDCEVYVVTRAARDLERAQALGAHWVGRPGDRPPVPLDAAVTFAPVGALVVEALEALERGGTVAINAVHLDGIPAFPYEPLWLERSVRSVANVTRRDALEFLVLAAAIPVRSQVEPFPLAEANEALRRLAAGEIDGSAVLVP